MLRRTCLVVALSALLVGGCAAPQQPGVVRTTYVTMATTSGAVTGALGTSVICYGARFGLSPARTDPDTTAAICALGGAVAGGAIALYGSLESETTPDAAQWGVVSLGTATAIAAVVGWLID